MNRPSVSQFADSGWVRVLDAPRELGDVEFHAVWHRRVAEDLSYMWLRRIVRTFAAATPPRRRRASKYMSET